MIFLLILIAILLFYIMLFVQKRRRHESPFIWNICVHLVWDRNETWYKFEKVVTNIVLSFKFFIKYVWYIEKI